MAVIIARKQWILAIVLILLVVILAEWLEYRFHTLSSNFSNKDKAQYELKT